MTKKIIVTGGAGFIGSHTVVELVKSGYTPIIIDNFSNSERKVLANIEEITGVSITCYEMDCTNVKLVQSIVDEQGKIDGVIHFAAYKSVGESVQKPVEYYQNNIGSLTSMLEILKKNGIKNIVFSSSCTVYGQPENPEVTETTEWKRTESPYGYSKQVCERLLEDASIAESYSHSSALLRYFNPVGAHPSGLIGELPLGVPNNLIPYVTQTAAGIREELTIFGDDYETRDGSCVRDFIHVVDLAKAHVHALDWLATQENVCEVFNIGTGDGNTVLEVVESFQKVNDVKLNYKIGARRQGDIEKIYANAEKANSILNWKAEKSLSDALEDAWRWQLKLNSK